jgi:hypothetical protein
MNKRHMKKLAFGLVLLGIGVLGVRRAEAFPGPSPDTMVVSVTPGNPQFGVSISSPDAGAAYGYNFGSVNMGVSTGSTKAIIVKSSGTVSEFFVMSAAGSGAAPWTARTVDGLTSLDTFELLGHFAGATQILDATFSTTNDIVGPTPPGAGSGLYNQGAVTPPGTSQNLWLKLIMPTSVTSSATQNLVLTINGQAT